MICIYKIVMASTLILIISTITIVSITGRDAVDLDTDKKLVEMEGCPYLENGEHAVTVKGSVSALISGCGHINYNSSDVKPQTYSLWFENKHHVGPHCTEHGREYFHFYCISKPPSPSADIKKGRMFISKVWPYDEGAINTESHRCALYEKIDDYNPTLRMAIGKGSSCDGLSDMLHHPEVIPWNINGNLLIVINTNRSVTTTATSTKSMPSISKRYEGRGYIPQNFGNRSNSFHRKIRETKDDDKITRHAVQMTSDGDDRHGAVTDLASYNDLRSKANVIPTSKPDVIVLAGSNPFALLLANRVHNNQTGSIKPLGLWDTIVKIFNN
ncbi:uncharacterized protein LOC132936342 [Metopolophium dirhodum]|uniref:uncharacterized protein LOC132936342 n=1 Tax=Metopolophium dirhodum TaxID=44670 RepID=UPI00298F6E17|nr:uncharacterized protein LOC132936342 [Metopolophium dirhodum]